MASEQNRAVVRRAGQAFNDRDRDAFDACYGDPLIVRTGDGPDDSFALDHDQHWEAARSWFDRLDLRADERHLLAEGDHVFVRWMYSGVHQGSIRGVEPTGKEIEFDGWQLFRVEDGLIVEERTLLDQLCLYTECGVIELPEAPRPDA